MIPRVYDSLESYLKPNKVLIIYGPRRVGKTFLLKSFLNQTSLRYSFHIGEDSFVQNVFSSQDVAKIKRFAGNFELIVIDEAQLIPNVGTGLKILVDIVPGIKVIATGSASFDLSNKIGEPLTGRNRTLLLYPVSQLELSKKANLFDLERQKEEYMLHGSYPEVLTLNSSQEKEEYLREIVNSYLLRDLLALENVKGSKTLLDLLRLIAFQIGNQVSLSELGNNLGIDAKTVGRYLDLLEKTFVIFNLRGFSRNLRKEVYKKSKYYFIDNGIRNALISNFNELALRNDTGMLWENFLISERLKKQTYSNLYSNNYFWRTWDGAEIDWIEEREGKLFGFEFKWSPKKAIKPPSEWIKTYPNTSYTIISADNYLDFIIK